MFVGADQTYMRELRDLATTLAPDRIRFVPPVPPADIVLSLESYDIGFCLLYPSTYNIAVSLPNKLFDYVVAGLAVCVGPSLSMAPFVEENGVGFVTPSYDPVSVAATLRDLTIAEIETMREASSRTATAYNSGVEMQKVRDICSCALSDSLS